MENISHLKTTSKDLSNWPLLQIWKQCKTPKIIKNQGNILSPKDNNFLSTKLRYKNLWFSLKYFKIVKVSVTQSCPTLCNPMDYSPPGSSVHEILQTRILEWVSIPFSRGSSQHGDWNQVYSIAGRFFTGWAISK